MLKILTTPNSILESKTKPVAKIDKKIVNLVKEMEKTLLAQKDPQGVGLAATQVASNLALFIIKPTEKSETEVFINPKILKTEYKTTTQKAKKRDSQLEGCLSIPKIWAPLKRADRVLLEYQNLKGEKMKNWFSGFKAIIVQHEVDHLDGVLFTKRVIDQGGSLYEERGKKLEKLEY